jgi:uncharacterized protein YuzE
MRVRMDEAADALYIRLDESAIRESEEVSPGVVLDFDESGRVVGIEIIDVRQKLPGADLRRVQFEGPDRLTLLSSDHHVRTRCGCARSDARPTA